MAVQSGHERMIRGDLFPRIGTAAVIVKSEVFSCLYNTSEAIVETERKMIEHSDRSVILADQSKIGTRTMCRVCGIKGIERLITTPPAGRSLIEEDMREAGLVITHAS